MRAGAVRPNPLFLNVGANVGKWALQAIENTPAAVVHSFELIPSTFALLKKAHEEAPEAVRRSWFVHGVGMARKAGQYRILGASSSSEFERRIGRGIACVARDRGIACVARDRGIACVDRAVIRT